MQVPICNENENDANFLFKLAVLNAVKTIRDKKKRVDKEYIFHYLTKSLASNKEIKLLEYVLARLIEMEIGHLLLTS